MALGAGSIAFTGFAADTNDALSFVALTDIAAGTVINFNQGKWDGDSFSNSASVWSWTATGNVAAGTIINMDMVNPAVPTSNIGDIDVLSSNGLVSFGATNIIYAYTGAANAPETFLSAITGDTFAGVSWDPATLNGTGLTDGLNAISFDGTGQWGYVDIAAYNGPRLGSSSFEDYLSLINNKANWISQTGAGNLGQDGIGPDVPFSNAGFSNDPNVQVVNFVADSLTVSQAEGDNGETIFTFIVERTGGTTGTVSFTGKIDINGLTLADDFNGTAPVSFTGTIEAGQTSGTVIVRVSGDTQFERNETFKLSLQSLSNNGANAVLGDHTISNATITNDDAAPATIAFVGINTDGGDNLAFVAVSDIAAGTVIHFTDDEWNGSGFTTGESRWSWTATSDISAGTVITMDGLNTAAVSSNHGSITFTTGISTDIDEQNILDQVYAYLGTPGQPTAFLTAISNGGFGASSQGGLLAGTGLTAGINAVGLTPTGADIAYYNGPRTGQTSMEDYLSSINNPANWVQQNTSADNTNDGTLPELPFPAHPFSTDPAVQIVQFAAGSLNVTKSEGQNGTETAFTFTIERTGGTEGDMTFTVRVPAGAYATAANAADFAGGMLPAITGTIPAGASSTTITILVKGENLYELAERFLVNLESASNPNASSVVIGNNATAAGTINNDDSAPTHILAGETHTAIITVTNNLTIDQDGSLAVATGDAISWKATNTNVVIDNSGLIRGNITSPNNNSGSLTINNHETGVIQGVVDLGKVVAGTAVTLNNAGHIELGDRIDLRDAKDGTIVVNNLAGGVITQKAGASDIMRPGLNSVVNNAGTIQHAAGLVGGGDGIDLQADAGKVNNYAGGLIEASRHAVTGDGKVQVVNDGTMIGRNGSAVNVDNDGTEAERAFVTNHGRMEGRSANLADSDGDAVDVDGLLTLENYGFIGGMGHNGYHDNEPNVSEGVAIGGGTITNYAGGEIYGYGRAIQVDNSSNANALGTTTIVNAGLIRGDGHLPTAVTPAEVAEFAERIRGGEAINLLGTYADSLTNTGQIIGGVKMGGGDDTLINNGSMTATGGSAINMGDGNDVVTLQSKSNVTGSILLGAGNDTFTAVAGDVVVDGGDGDDTITGGKGRDTLNGGAGIDIINGGDGNDLISGGEGNDNLQGAAGVDEIHGGDGDDRINGGGSADILFGDAGKDLIYGSDGNDEIHGGADNDQLHGEGGDDTISGDAGNDTFYGGIGQDTLIGGDGNDQVYGQDGNDTLMGGAGFDKLDGGTGIDTADYSADGEAIYVRLDQKWAMAQADRLPSWTDLVAGINGNTIEHDDLISIENITGTAFNDAIVGNSGDNVIKGGAGNDLLAGLGGNDTIYGGEGNDRITAGAGDQIYGDQGNDIVEISTVDGAPALVDGGEGNDTVKLLGTGTGSFGATSSFENLVVQSGTWSVTDGAVGFSDITVKDGASVMSTIILSGADKLTIEEGGTLGGEYNAAIEVVPTATDVIIDNAGTIARDFGLGVVLYNGNYEGGTGPLTVTITNHETGTIRGDNAIQWYDMFDQGGSLTINNEGSIVGQYEAILADNDEVNGPFEITINNFEGGVISGASREAMKIDGATINNWGTISGNDPDFNRKNVDGIQFTSDGGVVNNYAGTISGARHGITSDEVAFDTYNGVDGLIVGHNGSGVNIDGSGTVTNYGIIRGAAEADVPDDESSDIDGDGVDIDFDAVIHNYGRIEALGAKGFKRGSENFSEAIAAGGGEIYNHAGAELYSVDNGILIDDGDGGSAESTTFIDNAGTIEGVNGFGIKLVGNFDDTIVNAGTIIGGSGLAVDMGDGGDFLINTRTGAIVGAVSMGGGNDLVTHQGSTTVESGVAFDMGDGNDTLNLHDGSVVVGTVILGSGNDVVSSQSVSDLVIDAGDGQDSIATGAGDDIITGGAGIDLIHAGAGEDRIDGGLDNDQLRGGDGDDLIEGGAGDDYVDGGNDDDVIYGDAGNDTVLGGLGNDVIKGGTGDDIFVITSSADGRDSYDGGDGIDTLDYSALSTAVNLTLKDGVTTHQTDTIENVEDIIGGSANDKLTGNSLDNVLTGNAGDDTLKGGAGNDTLDGGAGIDNLDGGVGNDQLSGGLNDDVIKGAAGDDHLDGGEGNDDLDGGADNDTLLGGAGDDVLKGGAGNDVIKGGTGNDTLTGGAGLDTYMFDSLSDGIDTITDFKVSGTSMDQIQLSAGLFQSFGGDDAFDLIGSGFLRAVSSNGQTQLQIDVDGGGDSFVTLANLTGTFSNGAIADHLIIQQDPIA